MDLVEEDILMHYGVKRRSGRYPWGSGDNPYQHGGDFLARVEELQRLGKTEKQIADELHLSTTDLRMQVRVAKHERRALQADRARSLREDGKTLDEIASILGYANDSSVRALLNENTAANKNKAQATAEILKKELAEKGAIDVGTGVERQLGVSTGVLQEALFILETEGYNRYGVGVPQVNDPKKRTITPVISVPEIDQREVYQNLDLVKSVGDYTDASYTKAVDNGSYRNFAFDKAGYGLCQWTYSTRKAALLAFAKTCGTSIGDAEMQLKFFMKELREGYPAVLSVLKASTMVREASDEVLLKFERPADQSEAVRAKRAAYGQAYYNTLTGKETTMFTNSPLVSYTRISPNKTPNRNHAIDTVTIHCIVGQWTAKQGCDYFATTNRKCSANYVVGKDGSIGLSVEEKDRSWCSSSASNDNRAITIEVASDTTHPYKVTDAA